MTTISDAYAAALLETRGKIRTNTGGRRRPYRPTVYVTTPDPAIAEGLLGWGGGKLDTCHPGYDPSITMYSWRVRGEACLRVLEATLPYLVGDKAWHARHILQRQQERMATTCPSGQTTYRR